MKKIFRTEINLTICMPGAHESLMQKSSKNVTGGVPVLLSPGIHSFPFKLGLPIGLPSTFLGKHGWVQYYCKTALKEASGLAHKNQQVFIVMNPIDLNQEPAILAVSAYDIPTYEILTML